MEKSRNEDLFHDVSLCYLRYLFLKLVHKISMQSLYHDVIIQAGQTCKIILRCSTCDAA